MSGSGVLGGGGAGFLRSRRKKARSFGVVRMGHSSTGEAPAVSADHNAAFRV